MNLYVFLHDKYAGTLSTTINDLIFHYDITYAETCNIPLSHSMPIRQLEYTSFDCLHFFNALLPEGQLLENISTRTFISEYSTMKLLNMIGGDCAGAISFVSSYENDAETSETVLTKAKEISVKNYQELSNEEIGDIISENIKTPFFISNKNFKITVCGAKDKLALSYFDGRWHLPMKYAPSTHIIKPSYKKCEEDLSINEYICMKLASLLGIKVCETTLKFVRDIPLLISKRFDRYIDEKKNIIEKLHQESFSQALGIKSYTKYEKDGGPTFKDCFSLINKISSSKKEDIDSMVSIMLFNYLIGNCEAHGKNFALLYDEKHKAHLAPFFDLTSTVLNPSLPTKMAMSIGGEFEISKITKENFDTELKNNNISYLAFQTIVETFNSKTIEAFTEIEKDPLLSSYKYLIHAIKTPFTTRLSSLL